MAEALNLAIIVVALLALFYLLKGRPKAPPPMQRPSAGSYTPVPEGAPVSHWSDGGGQFDVEVLGESRYRDTIRRLAGEHGDGKADARHTALLLPDDANPYEDKAVAVFLSGEMVGYLAPKDALAFRQRLARQEIAGQLTSCDAAVRGGALWEGKRLAYAVWLDLDLKG